MYQEIENAAGRAQEEEAGEEDGVGHALGCT